jgi:hypothetical protein
MNNFTGTKRLGDDNYKKEGKSIQQTLSPNEIKDKLQEYVQLDTIDETPLNSHIRYFTIDKKSGKKQFRLGGFLTKLGDNNEYIILSNGNYSWSVQLSNTVFYKKMSNNELKEQIVTEIDDTFSAADQAFIAGAVEVITTPAPSFPTTDLTAVVATASVAPNAVVTKATEVLSEVAPVDNAKVTVEEPAVAGEVKRNALLVPLPLVAPTAV